MFGVVLMGVSEYRTACPQICGLMHTSASRKKGGQGKLFRFPLATQETIRFPEGFLLLYRPLPGHKTAGISVMKPHLCFIHLKQVQRYSFESCLQSGALPKMNGGNP